MWPPTKTRGRLIKHFIAEWVPIVQAIVTTVAVFVGGWWTYRLFVEEREQYPHANIEQKVSHVPLSEQTNLLRVGIDLSNAGKALMKIGQSTIRVQQILPSLPCRTADVCAVSEVATAVTNITRQADRFSWPLIAEREVGSAFDIEPGEKQTLEFEFVTPSDARVVRVYAYFRNDQRSADGGEVGWATSSYYDFHATIGGATK